MKDWLAAALIVLVLAFVWKGVGRLGGKDDVLDPEVITNPVYLEMRVNVENADRTLEVVVLIQAANDAECQKYSPKALKMMGMEIEKANSPAVKLKSVACKAELSPSHARLFDNEPGLLTYVSAARGDRSGREIRWIMWGMSAEESEMVCGLVPQLQKNLRGKVTCIHALRS